jgi:quinoprotein glucose dehydrogenase
MTIPKTGQSGSVGVLITRTLVMAGDPQFSTTPTRTTRGAMLRAYNKDTGEQVGEVLLPAPVTGHPMTYSLNGRQYIVVGVNGGNYTSEYISLRLPASEVQTTSQGRQ